MPSIFLTGLDGTGKSTLATALSAPAASNPLSRPLLRHQYESLFPIARAAKNVLRRRGVKSKLDDVFKPSGTESAELSPPSRSAGSRVMIYLVSTGWLVAGFARAWFWFMWARLRRRDLVSDRCFIDEILRAEWSRGSASVLARRLLALSPRPDLFVVLTPADLALTWERKKDFEYDLDGYRRKFGCLTAILDSPAIDRWNTLSIEVDETMSADRVLDTVQQRLGNVDP